jgi:transcriptional regulator with XRE-family HTH domain
MKMGPRHRLRELRLALGLTGPTIAAHAGMTKQNYSAIEAGRGAAPAETMARINTYLREEQKRRIDDLQAEIDRLKAIEVNELLFLRGGVK